MLRKLFRPTVTVRWDFIEKETVDEIIFRTTNIRNRLILELMDRGGMRIGEVLKLRFCDIQDRKLIIIDPKGGKKQEIVFIPQKARNRGTFITYLHFYNTLIRDTLIDFRTFSTFHQFFLYLL